MTESLAALTDDLTGFFVVTTLTSTYLVDLDKREITRHAGTAANAINPLERPQQLDRIEVCTVGQRARLHLLIDGATVAQPLTTTTVIAITSTDTAAASTSEAHATKPPPSKVLWETEGGEGQLDDWRFLPVLAAVLHTGLAGDSLRLTRGNRAVTLYTATTRGVPMTLTDGDAEHQVFFLDLDAALTAARNWLDHTATDPEEEHTPVLNRPGFRS